MAWSIRGEAAGVSWALAALLANAAPAVAAGFTSGTDVVVLVGVPGDVETEKAYQDQVARLLAILARPESRPASLHLLVDAPEAVRLPAGQEGEVAAATREGVLALAGRLESADRPRTLVVFGHGGRQGSEPVFHVRGPRVTPLDLSRLAAREAPSRVVMFFRGSGDFARALRGKARDVLASENAVGYRSDPVGMDILLGVWGSRPGASFEEICDRLGRETVAWYEERHLARQEEPTLWSGVAAPRVMARAASEAETAAAAGPSPAPEAGTASDAWQGITPVASGSRADADALVLRSRTRIVLGEDPAIRIESDDFVQVLTAEGTRRADVDLAFSPPAEDLAILDAEVRLPDGRLERFPAEDVGAGAEAREGEYRGPSRKRFSLPHAAPGAILRLHVQRQWKRFPLPYVFLETPLAGEDPVKDTEVELRVSSRSAFHYAFRNIAAAEPARSETRYGRVYTWRFRDVEAPRDEPLAPPDRAPRLLVSTFPDWEAFASWYRGLIREADQVTPEITARAREVTAGARSDRDKVVALYNEVTRLRYVAVPLGVNSHRPHAAQNVLRNRYGDCKDKANLFNTLLRAVDIPADLVLVPRFTQADEAVPGLAFNHAISRVRLGGTVLWADTTDDVSRFGLLPPGDPGRKVLVMGDGPAVLTLLPKPDPADHALRITGRVEFQEEEARASFEAGATGFADYALRAAARAAGAPRAAEPILALALEPSAGVFGLAAQEQGAVTGIEEAFRWKGSGTVHGLSTPVAGSRQRILRAPFWLPREWHEALHARRSPLFLNQGYPLSLDEDLELRLPAGSGAPALPPLRENKTGPLRWSVAWSAPAAGAVRARFESRLSSGELTLEESSAFQRQLGALLDALGEGAVILRGDRLALAPKDLVEGRTGSFAALRMTTFQRQPGAPLDALGEGAVILRGDRLALAPKDLVEGRTRSFAALRMTTFQRQPGALLDALGEGAVILRGDRLALAPRDLVEGRTRSFAALRMTTVQRQPGALLDALGDGAVILRGDRLALAPKDLVEGRTRSFAALRMTN